MATLACVHTADSFGNSRDSSTYANIDQVFASHIDLNFTVDFVTKVLDGTVVHSMQSTTDDLQTVWLDSQGLNISKVEVTASSNMNSSYWFNSTFTTKEYYTGLGTAVAVNLPINIAAGQKFLIKLTYKTNANSTAISWMTKEQTVGKMMPYMYTQCEDIACRSVAPMQDTPANKITYNATVRVPNDFSVYMSANSTGNGTKFNASHMEFKFQNQIPIPSYLIAIAVGNLTEKKMGNRTYIITEPAFMNESAVALDILPELLDKTEAYLTKYIWGDYKILILPKSFPMGGMENPLLTFASPTIITKDKSQVYVATHEIAHSWTGNDVTCENWSNMWLNEGFTVFEERKVSAMLHSEDFSKVNAYLGNISMNASMRDYGYDKNYSSLYPLVGRNYPDGSFSEIPYEKGFQLLYYIETLIGKDDMQKLLRLHINNHAQKSIVYQQFVSDFNEYLDKNLKDKAADIKSKMNWDMWVKQPGIPKNISLNFTTPTLLKAQKLANDALSGIAMSPEDIKFYNESDSNIKVVFLEQLINDLQMPNLTVEFLTNLDKNLNITSTSDPEVKQRWFPLGILKKYTAVTEPAHQFIGDMGRMKYLAPIYQAMIIVDRTVAQKWFDEFKNFYHPYTVAKLQQMINSDMLKKKGEEYALREQSMASSVEMFLH